MFAGIVKAVGHIAAQVDRGADRTLTVDHGAALGPFGIGASIAVNGVCLTVTAADERTFRADVSQATLAVTTLGRLGAGARVNLEPSLKIGDSLDGHIVTGHVDGVGEVAAVTRAGRSIELGVMLPPELAPYVARKGSIAIDGVSLTVNAVSAARFAVNIVPHTTAATIIGDYRPGTAVNIEVDVIARYLERLSESRRPSGSTGAGSEPDPERGITREFLRQHGYASND